MVVGVRGVVAVRWSWSGKECEGKECEAEEPQQRNRPGQAPALAPSDKSGNGVASELLGRADPGPGPPLVHSWPITARQFPCVEPSRRFSPSAADPPHSLLRPHRPPACLALGILAAKHAVIRPLGALLQCSERTGCVSPQPLSPVRPRTP